MYPSSCDAMNDVIIQGEEADAQISFTKYHLILLNNAFPLVLYIF